MRQEDWVLVGLISVIICIIVSRFLFPKNFNSLFSLKEYLKINSNVLLFSIFCNTIFYFLVALNISYFFEQPLKFEFFKSSFTNNSLILFFLGLTVYFLNVGLKAFIFFSLDWIEEFWVHLNFWSFAKAWMSWLLLLSSFVFFYLDYFQLNSDIKAFCLGGLIGILYIFFLIQRLIKKTKNVKLEWYYNILYLCALEILPLLVGFKYLTDFNLIV